MYVLSTITDDFVCTDRGAAYGGSYRHSGEPCLSFAQLRAHQASASFGLTRFGSMYQGLDAATILAPDTEVPLTTVDTPTVSLSPSSPKTHTGQYADDTLSHTAYSGSSQTMANADDTRVCHPSTQVDAVATEELSGDSIDSDMDEEDTDEETLRLREIVLRNLGPRR